jgi:hypothetical protein
VDCSYADFLDPADRCSGYVSFELLDQLLKGHCTAAVVSPLVPISYATDTKQETDIRKMYITRYEPHMWQSFTRYDLSG